MAADLTKLRRSASTSSACRSTRTACGWMRWVDPRRAEGEGHDAEIHLHHPDDPEPDRQHPAAGAAPQMLRLARRIRRADLRGRVLRRPDLGRHGRAAGAVFARPEPGHPYRLVLEDARAGAAARLCRRRLGVAEPHGRDARAPATAAPARSNRWSSPSISRSISTSMSAR